MTTAKILSERLYSTFFKAIISVTKKSTEAASSPFSFSVDVAWLLVKRPFFISFQVLTSLLSTSALLLLTNLPLEAVAALLLLKRNGFFFIF